LAEVLPVLVLSIWSTSIDRYTWLYVVKDRRCFFIGDWLWLVVW